LCAILRALPRLCAILRALPRLCMNARLTPGNVRLAASAAAPTCVPATPSVTCAAVGGRRRQPMLSNLFNGSSDCYCYFAACCAPLAECGRQRHDGGLGVWVGALCMAPSQAGWVGGPTQPPGGWQAAERQHTLGTRWGGLFGGWGRRPSQLLNAATTRGEAPLLQHACTAYATWQCPRQGHAALVISFNVSRRGVHGSVLLSWPLVVWLVEQPPPPRAAGGPNWDQCPAASGRACSGELL
jgi:hypothetical protein